MEVQAVWKKNYQVEVRARQFHVEVDEAPEYQGDDTGMMPTELFLSSLASCFCIAIVFAAKKKRVEIEDLSVSVNGDKDKKRFAFSNITVLVKSSLSSQKLNELIPIAKKYCFVSNTLSEPCPIEYAVD